MNYISHHEVAKRYDPEASPGFLFGSVVADLARMSGTRMFLNNITNPVVKEGMRFHKLTNKPAFDGQPAMGQIEADLRTSFTDFLPSRTALQASRVAKDLLFDGIHADQPQVHEGLWWTLSHVLDGKVGLANDPAPGNLMEVVRNIFGSGAPHYEYVGVVTDRLWTVLRTTRTPLAEHDLVKVDSVLESVQPVIFCIGEAVMQQTVQTMHEIFEPAVEIT